MTSATLLRRASVALVAFTLACGDSTAPNLSEVQVEDMLDAMSAVSYVGSVQMPGATMSSMPSLRYSPQTANATLSVSETVDCPNGGSATVNGTVTEDETAGTMSAEITQIFSGCAATSEQGRVWTFNGNPNIVTNISASSNEETGAFSMTATQVGGISFASDLGSGSCQINLTVTLSGTQTSFSGSVSGSACGRNIQQSFELTQ